MHPRTDPKEYKRRTVRLLGLEPDYGWVRQVLLPRVAGEDAGGG